MFYINNCVRISRLLASTWLFHSTRLFHSRSSGCTMDFLDSRCISGFTMDFWIYEGFLHSRWISRFTMDSWILDGFLYSRWIPGFIESRWIFWFTMDFWIHDRFWEAPHVWLRCRRLFFLSKNDAPSYFFGSPTRLTTLPQALVFFSEKLPPWYVHN